MHPEYRRYRQSGITKFIDLLIEKGYIAKEKNRCDPISGPNEIIVKTKETINKALLLSAHLPIVTSVATGIAYCRYYSRLMEAIGAKRYAPFYKTSFYTGKGSRVHENLALALSLFFSENNYEHWNELYNYLKSCETGAFEEVYERFIQIADSYIYSNLEMDFQIRNKVKKLLRNLFLILPRLIEILGIEKISDWNIAFLPEVEMKSYSFSFRGVPDLIIEFYPKEKGYLPKAIVVEWKTSESKRKSKRVQYMAQVIGYSLLEAERLLFMYLNSFSQDIDNVDRIFDHSKKLVLGKKDVSERRFRNIYVLPVIITLDPEDVFGHPAIEYHLFNMEWKNVEKKYDVMSSLCDKFLVMAEHLKLLLTNQEKEPIGVSRRLTTAPVIFRNGHEDKVGCTTNMLNLIRLTPFLIIKARGDPARRDKFPCIIREDSYCPLYNLCGYYFGRGIGENDDFDRLMWKIRFRILEEKELDLMVYLALYETFSTNTVKDVLNKIRRNGSIEYNMSTGRGFLKLPAKGSNFSKPELLIMDSYQNRKRKYMIDVWDDIKVEEASSIDDIFLLGKRKFRQSDKYVGYYVMGNEYLKSLGLEFSKGVREMPYLFQEGKTISIFPVPEGMETNNYNPLLGPSLFTRIESVEVNYNEGEVRYLLVPPSRIMNLQHKLFDFWMKQLRRIYKEIAYVVVETPADLTHVDLRTITYLQSYLGSSRGDVDNLDEIETLLQDNIDSFFKDNEYGFKMSSYLRRIIGMGGRKR